MAQNTYKAQLNYYDSSWGWGNEGTASQGKWSGTGARTGVLYFPGLAALKNKIINSVQLTATTGQTGYGTDTTKTVYVYNSASQGGIKTSLNAGHKTGSALGSCKAPMWDNTNTFTVSFLANSIAAGKDTYCIYNGASETDYLKWTAVTLTVSWQEPATQPTLSASTVNMGSAVTITTSANNSAYRHTLRYTFGSAKGTIASNVAGSGSWTPPVSLAAQIPNVTSGTGTIYCDTYSGSTLLGTKSVSITLSVPSSVKPTAGTLSAAIDSDTSGTGKYVAGMCKAKLTLSGAKGNYSTIKSYRITGGGFAASASTLTTGVLQSTGTITFTATVTDSRGRQAKTTCSISVISYAKPRITALSVYRCDANGVRKNAGTYAAIEIKTSYSTNVTGNALTVKAAYKLSTNTSYNTAVTVSNNGKTIIGGGNISAAHTYDVKITAADKYNTVTSIKNLYTKSLIFSIIAKGKGLAIGKMAELSGWLDIQWDTRIRGNLQIDGKLLGGYNLGAKTAIPQQADVDTYTEAGSFAVYGAANAKTIANLPVEQGGTLTVENIMGIMGSTSSLIYLLQTYVQYNGTRYTRYSTNSGTSWSSWKS